jgi:hypothetical protein
MLDWIKKGDDHPDHPMRDPAAAAKLLAEMRGADPLSALNDLGAWLDAVKGIPSHDEGIRGDILSLIQEAGGAHVSALLAQILAKPTGKQATRESIWNALIDYLRPLTGALCASARVLLKEAAANPSLHLPGAAGAARGLRACRMLAKVCLVHYVSVPPKLWRLAYAVHGDAEKADCATTPVHMQAAQKTLTTVTQELLGLLMLQSSSPEMMTPEQIEVADRVIEQLGEGFTLRPRGVTDNPFCFDATSQGPPRRAAGQPSDPDGKIRCFGAGTGYDALERLYKQLATTRTGNIKAFGKDIAPHVQISTLQHLLAFWGEACPYSPPAHSPATGSLRVIHGYAQIWQHLSHARSGKSELMLAEDGDGAPQTPETWALQDTGGDELGVEIPQRSCDWARCGDVVGVLTHGADECWLGVIRSMHAEWGHSLHVDIAILSRDSKAVRLRAIIAKGEENVFSEETARQFAFNSVRAITLSDGSAAAQRPDLLVPPEGWKEGRIYEAAAGGAARYLRSVQLRQRGDDYVRATFEWVAQA